MDENQKNQTFQKWKPILDNLNVDNDKKEWLSEYAEMHSNLEQNEILNSQSQIFQDSGNTSDWNNFIFPVVKKIAATTIAGGGWIESEERKFQRARVQKLKRILNKEDFNDVVSKEEFDDIMTEKKDVFQEGLLSVQPLSAPTGVLFFMDYKYEDKSERIRKERNNKIKRILDNDSES